MLTRPCWAEIDRAALTGNLQHMQRLADGATLAAIVKGDAYGHSLAICAPALRRAGAEWLAVTSTDEACAAAACCAEPEKDNRILVLSGPFSGDGPAVARHGFVCAVWQRSHLEELQRGAQQAGRSRLAVHLELDTGMSRQGVSLDALQELLLTLAEYPAVTVDGVMTHLYAADELDRAATDSQLERLAAGLQQVCHWLQKNGRPAPRWLSVGNSAALLDRAVRESLLGMAAGRGMRLLLRPGIGLYGVAPEFDPEAPEGCANLLQELRPVLSWKTRITSLRRIPAGTAVGYNASYRAQTPMHLALLAVGYADGLSRRVSPAGHALIGGERVPYLGRISMDQAVVDVSRIDAEALAEGAEVVLLGSQAGQTITALDHARWAGTIPWEILTSITARVPRIAMG